MLLVLLNSENQRVPGHTFPNPPSSSPYAETRLRMKVWTVEVERIHARTVVLSDLHNPEAIKDQ